VGQQLRGIAFVACLALTAGCGGSSPMSPGPGAVNICGFHDHNNENDPTFKGRIIVQ